MDGSDTPPQPVETATEPLDQAHLTITHAEMWERALIYPHADPDSPRCHHESWGMVHVKPGCRCPRRRR